MTDQDPPVGYVSLYTASTQPNVDLNVMGVVTDVMPPKPSKGTDWTVTFSMIDVSGDSYRVRFFAKRLADIPKIQGTGDVVILRKIKYKDYQGMPLLLSNFATMWTVFPSNSIPRITSPEELSLPYSKSKHCPAPSVHEMRYAVTLCNTQDRSSFTTLPAADPAAPSTVLVGPRDKFALIKDISVARHFDLVGQVVKVYTISDRLDLYITDYTSNEFLFNYEPGGAKNPSGARDGDEFGYTSRPMKKWQGPFGKQTLCVTLFPPHASYFQHRVKVNDFVLLTNVRIKLGKDGTARLEGILHTDKKWERRIHVCIVYAATDERVKDILRRKKEYLKQFKAQSNESVEETGSQKRKAHNDHGEMEDEEEGEGEAKLSKPQKKRERRKKKQQEVERDQEPKEALGRDEVALRKAIFQPNQNIHCAHHEVSVRSLTAILDTEKTHLYTTPKGNTCVLPFQNICSRATVRVLDFFPPDLEDFAARHSYNEFDALSNNGSHSTSSEGSSGGEDSEESLDEEDGRSRKRMWKWRFALLLEDVHAARRKGEEAERLVAYVADDDAEFMLKLSATNLRKDAQTLAQLREKLFMLWGDLEERKVQERARKDKNVEETSVPTKAVDEDAMPLTRPFTCCLKEYGVRVTGASNGLGWERKFRVFGTVIV